MADCHVGQRPGDAAAMVDWLHRAAAIGCGEVVYLGDAFQYLIGMSKFWSAGVRQVVGAWRELRDAGIRVALIEGNRDFFLEAADLASEVDVVGRRLEVTAGGRRFRFEHGDLVNRRDLQYRFWSRVSKSTPARIWADLLPRRIALSIVERMEARLALTNRRFRYVKPVSDLLRSADLAWSEGVDVLLWGHFHTPWWCSRDQRLAVVLPAWLEHRVALLVEEDGRAAWVEKNLTPRESLQRLATCASFPLNLDARDGI